jgi:hypothetical protein
MGWDSAPPPNDEEKSVSVIFDLIFGLIYG